MIKRCLKCHPKKTLLAAITLFAFTAFMFPNISEETIEVYIGVMPEEVSPLIKSSLALDKSSGSTLIISRSNIRSKEEGGVGELLEQSLDLYSNDLKNPKNIAVTTDQMLENIGDESDVVRQLALKIRDNTSGVTLDINDHLIPGFKFKMSKFITANKQAIISIAKIGTGHIKRIFVQLPEMGFQSYLSYEYGVAILESISDQFSQNKIIFTTTFAGGGAISTDIFPGETEIFSNSISTRVYKIPGKNQYIGKVSVVDVDGENILFRTMPYDNPYKALEVARLAFLKLGDIPQQEFELSSMYINGVLRKGDSGWLYQKLDDEIQELQRLKRIVNSDDLRAKQENKIAALKEQIDNMEEEAEKMITEADLGEIENRLHELRSQLIKSISVGKTSITASFFLEDLEKEAGNNIGKMITVYREFGDNSILSKYKNSINTQVVSANMEDDIIFRIYNHIMRQGFSKHSYLYLLMRIACDPFRINKVVKNSLHKWTKKREYTVENYVDAVLWRLSGFNNKFLSENAHWTFYEIFKNGQNEELFYKTGISKGGIEDIVVDPFWREIGTDFLPDVLEKGDQKNEILNFRKEFEALVNINTINDLSDGLYEIKGIRDKLKKILKKTLKGLGFEKDNGNYEVWVRRGSWANNPSNILNSLDFRRGSNADRAFYVSTNVSALIAGAKKYFKNLLKAGSLIANTANLEKQSED